MIIILRPAVPKQSEHLDCSYLTGPHTLHNFMPEVLQLLSYKQGQLIKGLSRSELFLISNARF